MIDVKAAVAKAKQEVAEEKAKKAIEALKRKLKQRDDAQQIVVNIDREIKDLEASLADGSFAA